MKLVPLFLISRKFIRSITVPHPKMASGAHPPPPYPTANFNLPRELTHSVLLLEPGGLPLAQLYTVHMSNMNTIEHTWNVTNKFSCIPAGERTKKKRKKKDCFEAYIRYLRSVHTTLQLPCMPKCQLDCAESHRSNTPFQDKINLTFCFM